METRPFTNEARKIRSEGYSYKDMADGCRGARSTAWWHALINEKACQPPPPQAVPQIAALFGLPHEEVAAMIALEWYGVRPHSGHSTRADALAGLYDQMPAKAQEAVRLTVGALFGLAVQANEVAFMTDSTPDTPPGTSAHD
ncbi:hypothetical protein [Nonomuraea sp. NPDC050540]|uniref:hypothetical protein n=1 Tax=Nonomuraea sp. NPDC050540 TaxID=3364367 RepID=UPI0037AB7DEE